MGKHLNEMLIILISNDLFLSRHERLSQTTSEFISASCQLHPWGSRLMGRCHIGQTATCGSSLPQAVHRNQTWSGYSAVCISAECPQGHFRNTSNRSIIQEQYRKDAPGLPARRRPARLNAHRPEAKALERAAAGRNGEHLRVAPWLVCCRATAKRYLISWLKNRQALCFARDDKSL